MSNSNRNPKILKDYIEKSRLILNDNGESSTAVTGAAASMNTGSSRANYEEAIKNLRNLSQEEKTEIGLLKSRIDEQSRLIMILKQRGDEFINKNMALEKLNDSLMESKETMERDLNAMNEKYTSLMDSFNYLANNHEELIKIKDEYKQKNVELTAKNKTLLEKFEKSQSNSDDFDQERNALNQTVSDLQLRCAQMENKLMILEEENEQMLTQSQDNSHKYHLTLTELENLRIKSQQFENSNHELNHLIERLKHEKAELLNVNEKNSKQIEHLNVEREELMQLNENLKREKKNLIDNHANLERNYKNICLELNKFKETYNKDSLHQKLNEVNRKYDELEKEFDAYRKYSNTLIEKERELNNKLRFMIN